MRARTAWLAGAAGAAIGGLPQASAHAGSAPAPADDPRAEELRRKLDESRTVVEEREEFDSAETPVDEVDGPEPRRRPRQAVHERARAAADEMRGHRPNNDASRATRARERDERRDPAVEAGATRCW